MKRADRDAVDGGYFQGRKDGDGKGKGDGSTGAARGAHAARDGDDRAPGRGRRGADAAYPPAAPPALDLFLDSVRRATPPTARILAAGAPPGLVFYRATAALYPRRIYSASPTDFAHARITPSARWPGLLRLARRDRARYVLVWSLPSHLGPQPVARARKAVGTLVEVRP